MVLRGRETDLWCVETNYRSFYRMNIKDGSTI